METCLAQLELQDETVEQLTRWLRETENMVNMDTGLQTTLAEKQGKHDRMKVIRAVLIHRCIVGLITSIRCSGYVSESTGSMQLSRNNQKLLCELLVVTLITTPCYLTSTMVTDIGSRLIIPCKLTYTYLYHLFSLMVALTGM